MLDNPLGGGLATLSIFVWIAFVIVFLTLKQKSDPLDHLTRYELVQKANSETLMEHQFTSLKSLLRFAYQQHPSSPFVIGGSWRRWDTVILPPKVFDSIKSLPEAELSFYDALDTRFLHHLTTIKVPWEGGDTPMLRALAIDLTRHLTNHLPDIADETDYAYQAQLPPCEDDWVEIYPMKLLPRILGLVSGRILVGLPLSRERDFLDLKLGFFKNSFIAMYILGHMVPKPLRSTVALFLPWIRNLKKAHTKMQRIMEPIVKKRQEDHEAGRETPSDLLEWVINNAPEHLKYDVAYQSHAQLITNVASIQSLYIATAHAWFDIAANPDCAEALRAEWQTITADAPPKIPLDTMVNQGRKLDSFIKESARVNPSQLTALEYVLRREIHLKDGTVLPKGTYVAAALSAANRDPHAWSNPETFDPFRFEKLRQTPGNEGKFQFYTTGVDQLSFGYGRHPCPGRYYAGNVLKIMLAKLVDTYEVKLPDGQGRPKNAENWIASKPDENVPILIRKRNRRDS